ncbi:hypothetical protein [Janibacter cremeus]|uniref:YokE-like PH domain-containing protein n=1 Tax=Janibacter cremeus TaxID=1285192 RepID=A0A852VP64_9MICO|nr:hypothetical protein [Janibacter cremeus]NYF98772.1 hypothetical protein [Janibacter cremeus]
MTSPLASTTYSTALARNELYASFALRREVPTLLDPEEEVLLVLPGVAGQFPDVLIVIRQRALLAKVTGWFSRVKIKREAPLGRIRGIAYSGWLFARVKLEVDGGRDLTLVPNRRADAWRFVESFEHLLQTG